MFADNKILVAHSKEKLQRQVLEFGTVCGSRKLRVDVGKNNVLSCPWNDYASGISVCINSY